MINSMRCMVYQMLMRKKKTTNAKAKGRRFVGAQVSDLAVILDGYYKDIQAAKVSRLGRRIFLLQIIFIFFLLCYIICLF